MTTKIHSFRLTPDAYENISRLATEYDFSESKILNIILTAKGHDYMENNTAASEILESYWSNIVLNRHATGSQ